MSCYVIESNKLFLRCRDIQVFQMFDLGEGLEYEALQIGDRDVIRGHDLERLKQDFMSLGMMVNREGLCFLKIPESNVSYESQVEYYRMFDLFDWSKYYVKPRLNTRWVRNDIVTGRPIFEMSSEKDAELIENKRLHSCELVELKRKHSQDIEELKQKHIVVLAELELIKRELKAKQNEAETRERQEVKKGVRITNCDMYRRPTTY